ncbi:hypothetical protein [Desulfotomaculum copahuensis]|nr:hypothetical protein [Desulfotomaculum copahuensis]
MGWKDFESKVSDVKGKTGVKPDRALLRRQSEMESPEETGRIEEDNR